MDNFKRPKLDVGVLKRLIKDYIWKYYKFRLIIVMICLIASTVSSVAGGLYLQTLIDDYITPLIGVENPVLTSFIHAIGIMISIYAIGVFSSFIYTRLMVKVSEGTMKKIRDEMYAKNEKLPIKFFDTNKTGDIMSRYTNDTDTLSELISQFLPQFVSSAMTILIVFISMIITNIYLTLVSIGFLVIILLITKFVSTKSGKYYVGQQASMGKIDAYIEEMITGQKVVKVFCHEETSKREFDNLNEELCETVEKANRYGNILGPINAALGNAQFSVIALVGGILAVNGIGNISIGLIVAFLQLSKNFIRPITQISHEINSVIRALAGGRRIFEIIDAEPEKDDGYVTLVNARYIDGELVETKDKTDIWAWKHPHHDGRVEYVELKGHIEMTNVDFSYVEGKQVLQDVSLYAKPGQKIAFVGATGAGKTTITNLLNRFYDIEDGKIRYDGININKIKKDDLRRSLGMVLQDTHLFTGTIKENIKYGNDDATDEEVIAAAKLANAHDFITRLPKGYDTEITNDGESLSQGQRQLISIARCALVDPPVMILDEATSSIDTRTEKIVQSGMDKLMKGRTVLVIAHRLSTIQNAKAIMVMDHGKIIERGEHDDLLKLKGIYYQLYTGAFELE